MSQTPTELKQVIRKLREFAAARNWRQFHDPKNLSMAIASEAGELLSLLRWVENQESDDFASNEDSRLDIEDEVADVGIFLLLLCDRIGVDLVDVMMKKIEKNEKNYPVEESKGHAKRVRP